MGNGVPVTKASLAKQMTHAIFYVTCYHKLAGGVVGYTTDPEGAGMQVRPNLDMCDTRHFVQVNSLVAGTGTPMPMLVPSGQPGDEEWCSQLDLSQEDGTRAQEWTKVKELHKTFMHKLKEQSNAVRAKNVRGKGRVHPFSAFDPLILERSVSL